MTSPSRASARSTARSDLPAVVAPTTAIRVMASRGGRGGELASLPGVARAGAPDAQRGVVGAQVMRRGAGDAGGDDVARARAGFMRREVHQAVVAGAAGHAVRGGVLAALALGDEDFDHGAVPLRVLLGRDLLDERDE